MKTFNRLGKLNRYTCNLCGLDIITIDRSVGVTPFSIICKATAECRGHMVSAMYRVPSDLLATWEWYRPTTTEFKTLGAHQKQHVEHGGLLLRRCEVGRVETEPEYQPGQAKREAVARVAGWRKGHR